jgi:hypothetical protein
VLGVTSVLSAIKNLGDGQYVMQETREEVMKLFDDHSATGKWDIFLTDKIDSFTNYPIFI